MMFLALKNFWKRFSHASILLYFILYILCFRFLERVFPEGSAVHIMHIKLDDEIPFIPCFIIPYLLWFVYVGTGVVYFVFHDRNDFFKLCAFLFIGMTSSLLICALFPNGTNFRPRLYGTDLFTRMVAALYRLDTPTNVFPSIHCYNSIGIHLAVTKSREIAMSRYGQRIQRASGFLAFLIILSTMFLKQHSVVDVAGAMLMAYIVHGIVYSPVAAEFQFHRPLAKRHPATGRRNANAGSPAFPLWDWSERQRDAIFKDI